MATVEILETAFSLPIADLARTHRFYVSVFGSEACTRDEELVSLKVGAMTVFFIPLEEFNQMLKLRLGLWYWRSQRRLWQRYRN